MCWVESSRINVELIQSSKCTGREGGEALEESLPGLHKARVNPYYHKSKANKWFLALIYVPVLLVLTHNSNKRFLLAGSGGAKDNYLKSHVFSEFMWLSKKVCTIVTSQSDTSLSRQEKHFTDGEKEMKKEGREERRNVCVDIESVSVSAYCNRRMQKTAYRNRKHLDAMGRN